MFFAPLLFLFLTVGYYVFCPLEILSLVPRQILINAVIGKEMTLQRWLTVTFSRTFSLICKLGDKELGHDDPLLTTSYTSERFSPFPIAPP